MDVTIPSPEEVAAALAPLGHAQMQELARLSGVPFTTLWKIKTRTTKDPGVSTVRDLWPHVEAAAKCQPLRRAAADVAKAGA